MDDDRVRVFETQLWIGGAEIYRRSIDPDCLMVLPQEPFVLSGDEAIEAVSKTPRWSRVELGNLTIARPEEGLIALAYRAEASRGDEAYAAWCTSTYRRIAHGEWRVVQHQQSLVPSVATGGADGGPGAGSETERAQAEAAQDRETERGYQ